MTFHLARKEDIIITQEEQHDLKLLMVLRVFFSVGKLISKTRKKKDCITLDPYTLSRKT